MTKQLSVQNFPLGNWSFRNKSSTFFLQLLTFPAKTLVFYGDYRVYLEKYIVKKIIQIKKYIFKYNFCFLSGHYTFAEKNIYNVFVRVPGYTTFASDLRELFVLCGFNPFDKTTTTHRSKFWPETDRRTDRQIYSQP